MKPRIVLLLFVLGPALASAQEDAPTEAAPEEAEPAEPEATAPDKIVETPKDKSDLVLTEIREETAEPPEVKSWDLDFTLMGASGLPRSKFGFELNYEGQLPAIQAEVGFAIRAPFMVEKTDAMAFRYSQDVFVPRQYATVVEGGGGLEGSATVVAVAVEFENVQFEVPVTLGPLAFQPFVQSLAGGYRFEREGGSLGGETHTELGEQNGRWKFGNETGLGLNIGPNPDRWNRSITPSLVVRYDLVDIESDLVVGHMIVSGLILGIPMAAVQRLADAKLDETPILRDTLKIASQAATAVVWHSLLHDSHNWPWADPPTLAYERPVAGLRFDW